MPVFPLLQMPAVDGSFDLSREQDHHLRRVLRVKPGQEFEVSLPDGRRGRARLERRGDRSRGLWLEELPAPDGSPLPVWLGIGLLRKSRLEWLVEKATELGLSRLSLLWFSQGSIPKNDDFSVNKINRLNKISQEALKQCERNAFTQIEAPQSLESFLARLDREAEKGQRLLLLERSSAPLLPEVLADEAASRVLLVGPEGGFQEAETRRAEAAGFHPVSLGPTVLRSETAALAALSCLHLHHAAKRGERA